MIHKLVVHVLLLGWCLMITCYFGVPGCGKTTLLTKLAQEELKKMSSGKSPYQHVLTNFPCAGTEQVSVEQLGAYQLEYCLILLDELTLEADSRDFKSFSQTKKLFFILHRHVHCDVVYFTQDFTRVDKTIRDLTMDLWYCTKSVVPLLSEFTVCTRIFRNININEFTSELTLGYRFAKPIEVIFSHTRKILFRRPWYKFFDSFDKTGLEDLQPFEFISWGFTSPSDDVHSVPDDITSLDNSVILDSPKKVKVKLKS